MIAVAHWHTFLVLTKRSRRMREYYGDPDTRRRIAEKVNRLSLEILSAHGPFREPPPRQGLRRHLIRALGEPVAHEPLAPHCTGSQGFSRGQIRNSEHSLDGKSAAWARTVAAA